MKTILAVFCFSAVVSLTAALAQTPAPSASPAMPTWQDEIAKGHLPYHQLTGDDFPVDDKAHPDAIYWVKTFVDPQYRFDLKSHSGWVYAYVTDWMVYSGFDRSESSRKSSFHGMKAELPFAQALLDISEIHARELAAFKTGELPQGRGASMQAAQADLEKKIASPCEQKYKEVEIESDALAKATNNGENKKKTLEMAAGDQEKTCGHDNSISRA
jgi:hypothetical protein